MGEGKRIVDFERPPVHEVAMGVQFLPLRKLRAAHFGNFWDCIKERYPHAEEHFPVSHMVEADQLQSIPRVGVAVEMGELPLVPRCWFLSSDKLQLVQVQSDRFLRNWRHLISDHSYPHYEELSQAFFHEWNQFLQFATKNNLDTPIIDQCELTYINHIPKGDGWTSAEDLPNVFRNWSGVKYEHLPQPEAVTWKAAFPLIKAKGRLHVQLNQGVTGPPERTPILALEMTARGLPPGQKPEDLAAWFDAAHEAIVTGFVDLTTPEMHKIWKRTK